jgi:tetratricopeptide (TPR) repeat protein
MKSMGKFISRRVLALLSVLSLVILVSYIFLLNPSEVTVAYGNEKTFTAPLALILIISFSIGATLVAITSIIFGTLLTYQHWLERKKINQERKNLSDVNRAKELMSGHNFEDAAALLKRILVNDPKNSIARVFLAETYADTGDLDEALQTLDIVRSEERDNISILLLGAKLYQERGDMTSAYDHLFLAHKIAPENVFILKPTIETLSKLERFNEAIELQRSLIKLLRGEEYEESQEMLASLELADAKKDIPEKLKANIEALLKRHRDYSPALIELSKLAVDEGRLDEASKLLCRAYGQTGDSKILLMLAEIWLKNREPQQAIKWVYSAAKSNINSFVIVLQLALGLRDEARENYAYLIKTATTDEASKLSLFFEPILYENISQKTLLGLIKYGETISLPGLHLLNQELPKIKKDKIYRSAPEPELSTP